MRPAFLTILVVSSLSFIAGCSHKEENKFENRTITLNVIHGPVLQSYLSAMKEKFLQEHSKLSDGTEVKIELTNEGGVGAASKIARGVLKADAWIAPSSSLINYTNIQLSNLGPRQVDCVQLFATPIVFATQPRNASYFHAVDQKFSWNEFFESRFRASSSGEANSDLFAYNHGNPRVSHTGLSALTQLAYLASYSKESTLDLDTLKSPHTFEKLKQYEQFVGSYGASEGMLLARAANAGTRRVLFSITSEQELALYNQSVGGATPALMALYPSEGSFWNDYVLCMSDADWVSPAHRAAYRAWAEFLQSQQAQFDVKRAGFRPSVVQFADVEPLTSKFGINTLLPDKSFLPVPGEVTSFLFDSWPQLRRPAAVTLLLDTSGSMEGEALAAGKTNFRNLLPGLRPGDLTALVTFSAEPKVQSELTSDINAVVDKLNTVQSMGGSALYDGLIKAIEMSTEEKYNGYRKFIVMFTDGDDKNSEANLQRLIDIAGTTMADYNINLYIFGISREGLSYDDLKRVAKAANGTFKEAPIGQVDDLFQNIFSNL